MRKREGVAGFEVGGQTGGVKFEVVGSSRHQKTESLGPSAKPRLLDSHVIEFRMFGTSRCKF